MISMMTVIIIIVSFLGLMLVLASVAGIWMYMYFRHWIFIITKSNNLTIRRGYWLGGASFAIKKGFCQGLYATPPGTIGSFRGQKAVFIREGAPAALVWPVPPMGSKDKEGKDFFEWHFISGENLFDIANTEHVSEVAKAGASKDTVKDVLILLLLVAILVAVVFIALKVFGVLKGKEASPA